MSSSPGGWIQITADDIARYKSFSRSSNSSAPRPYQPFPVDLLPHHLAKYIVETSSAIGCDPALVGVPLLPGIASCIGNARQIRLKTTWAEPVTLWSGVVAESGDHKSPALDQTKGPLERRQAKDLAENREALERFEEERLAYERELSAWRKSKSDEDPPQKPEAPKAARRLIDDITVEALAMRLRDNPRGLLLASDELKTWFGSFDRYASGGSDAARWLQMHRAGPVVVDRKTGTDQTIYVPRANVSITGMIQPATLKEVLSAEHRSSGLAARFLFAWPPTRPRAWSDKEAQARTMGRLEGLLEAVWSLDVPLNVYGVPTPIDIEMDPDARQAYIEFYRENGQVMATLDGDERAAFSKLEGYAARLSLVLHLVKWAQGGTCIDPGASVAQSSVARGEFAGARKPSLIDLETVTAAIALTRWFASETERIYQFLDESPKEREERQLRGYITGRGGSITPRQLARGPKKYRGKGGSERAEADLNSLVESGEGYWDLRIPESGGHKERTFVSLPTPCDSDTRPANVATTGIPLSECRTVSHETVSNGTNAPEQQEVRI